MERLKSDATANVDRFLAAVKRSRNAVLALNHEGLLPSQPYAAVRPQLAIIAQLRQLHLAGVVRLVLFTDRQSSRVVNCLGCTPPPEIWGVGGLERAKPGEPYDGPELTADQRSALTKAYEIADDFGLQPWVEKKPGGLGLYLNGFAPEDALALGRRLWNPWFRIADRSALHITGLKHGIELRIPGRTRSDAIRTILSEIKANTPIAYIGTDVLDIPAMEMLSRRGLTAFFSQSSVPKADLCLADLSEISGFLEQCQAAATTATEGPRHRSWRNANSCTKNEKCDEHAQGPHYPRRFREIGRADRLCSEIPAS